MEKKYIKMNHEKQGVKLGTKLNCFRIWSNGREADHSPQSSAEVKNAWSYTSTPPIRLHGVMLS
jgi:hypothetical protein